MPQIFTTFEEVQLQDNGRIELRKEQLEAIKEAKDHFKQKAGYKFLWNAKMRFGKTVCALQLAKELGYRRILIVTHRPTVNKEWLEAYEERFSDVIPQYSYGTKSDTQSEGTDFYTLKKRIVETETFHFLFFASMQYLRRSNLVGGDNSEQLKKDIMTYDWDLVIVDEAHEGTRTELGQKVLEYLEHKTTLAKDEKDTRMLHLSGTPFNLYEDFKDNEIFTWDYVDEQTAKNTWPRDEKEKQDQKEGKPNPYAVLPHMNILTFSLASVFDKFIEEGGTFKFRDFFRTKTGSNIPEEERGKFVHEEDVREFIAKLRGKDDDNNFPFSNDEFRKAFRHTLWIVPGVKEAKALKTLLKEDKIFSKFEVVNVAGNNDDELKDSALDSVLAAITDQPDQTRTITLSCGRLTTGTTVKPWTAVLYLKGSEDTKAATYMQTIFRVQSPCFIGNKMKTECYVFDFDYQRTLKVVAETAKYSTIAKKASNQDELKELTQDELDKKNMQAFLNCCNVKPLVPFTEDGAVMTEFNVESIFKRLESVYVDRLVTSGFNDKCLYDMTELNKIDKNFINLLREKGAAADHIEGERRKKGEKAIDVNNLTEEEKEKIKKLEDEERKRLRGKRNEEWDKLPQEKKDAIIAKRVQKKLERDEFKKRISDIRGISLRIPLLMFGGADNGNTKTPLTVDNFTKLITDESWKEFMPKEISKDDFTKIRKVFKATRFEEAGKKYRALAKEADNMHIEDRMERITTIHSWFKNPDKETVLTPWNVVNMHLHTALGGYSFFDPQDYKSPVMKEVAVKDENGQEVCDEYGNVRTESVEIPVTEQPTYHEGITNEVFGVYDSGKDAIQTHILEINSKTGLYPLYMAYNLYRLQMDAYIREKAYDDVDNLSVEEEQATWDNVIKNNIFVICNTKMAAQITFRTLMGFRDEDKGQHHIKTTKLVERASKDSERVEFIKELKSGKFWGVTDYNMKFNAIIGNPPYQMSDKGEAASDAAAPIYQYFVEIAKSLEPDFISIIMPSKWMVGGRSELSSFREEMKNDCRIRQLIDYEDDRRIFPTAHNDSGICYFIWDSKKTEQAIDYRFITTSGEQVLSNTIKNRFTQFVIRDSRILPLLEKIFPNEESLANNCRFSSVVSKTRPFGLRKDLFNNPERYPNSKMNTHSFDNSVKVYGVKGKKGGAKRTEGYITNEIITDSYKAVNKFKIFFTTSYSTNAKIAPEPIKGYPDDICTETFLLVGPFNNKEEMENCYKYMHTKFFRFLLYYGHGTMQVNKDVFSYIPLVDFSKTWDDEKLYKEFNINSEKYVDLIENVLK